MGEHTKGPWAVAVMGWSASGGYQGGEVHAMRPTGRYVKQGDEFVPETPMHGTRICTFYTQGAGYGTDEGRANARLIAAAPDLAEAAAALLAASDGLDEAAMPAEYAALRAALTRAQGDA